MNEEYCIILMFFTFSRRVYYTATTKEIPRDTWYSTLEFLDIKDIISFSNTNRENNQWITDDETIWRPYVEAKNTPELFDTADIPYRDIVRIRTQTQLNWSLKYTSSKRIKVEVPSFNGATCLNGTLLIIGGFDGIIRIWDIKSERLVDTLHEHTEKILSIDIHNKFLASSDQEGTVILWKKTLAQKYKHKTTIIHPHGVSTVRVNNQYIITACYDFIIRVYNIEGDLIDTLSGHTDFIKDIQFANGSIISCALDFTFRQWHQQSEIKYAEISAIVTGNNHRIALVPNTSFILIGGIRGIEVINIRITKSVYFFDLPKIGSMHVVGSVIYVCDHDGDIHILNISKIGIITQVRESAIKGGWITGNDRHLVVYQKHLYRRRRVSIYDFNPKPSKGKQFADYFSCCWVN